MSTNSWTKLRSERKPAPAKLGGKRVWRLPLSKGKFALVDGVDLALVSKYTWTAYQGGNTFYAFTHLRGSNSTMLLLHQVIGKAMGIVGPVDHKSRNGLDNRRRNLRPGPQKKNQANQGKLRTRKTSSRFKGVSWFRSSGKWRAQITVSGTCYHLGLFTSQKLAAYAYDDRAWAAWGSYAQLNFPSRYSS